MRVLILKSALKMIVFNQLIVEIIDINTLIFEINKQKTFLIEEKIAIFGAHDQVRNLDSRLNFK